MILLCTLNARYQHAAFGLRYLYANLGPLSARARIMEFTIAQNPRDIAERILAAAPKVVGFGVYIWNTTQTREVVSILKKIRPEIVIVLGGPEVSHEAEGQEIVQLADHVIQGEADFLFREFCEAYLLRNERPGSRIVRSRLPEIGSIAFPYSLYTDEDLKNRVLYVEASRGCPYRCEYCLSSLDKSVRNFPVEPFLVEIDRLIERGARQFKFVDRTFNLSIPSSTRILSFFLERVSKGLFIHFEMVPDRLPTELKELVARFPEGALQFEIGIQTWSPEVSKLISRRQDYAKIRENMRYLVEETGVHVHADLIAGLPGETPESFRVGFDALASLKPHEIQVGILKRLKGTPIIRHDREYGLTWSDAPPFQILQTSTFAYEQLQRVARFSRFWDLFANSGNFKETMRLFEGPSLYTVFETFCDFLAARHPQGHGVALLNLVESAWIYFRGLRPGDTAFLERVRQSLVSDYAFGAVRRDVPGFLRGEENGKPDSAAPASAIPKRQKRHLSEPQTIC